MPIAGTLTPAYGRDYKSLKDAQTDFDANKDFTLNSPFGGGYINKEQIVSEGNTTIPVRYNKLQKYGVLKVK